MGHLTSHRLGVVLLTVGLSACAVGPNFRRPTPPTATGYGSAPSQGETGSSTGLGGGRQHFDSAAQVPAEWWKLFESPKLNALIAQALEANPDLAAARAALREAHELYEAQLTSFFPTAQGGFSATRAKNALGSIANPTSLPQSNPYYNLFTAQVSVSYLPDVFGATRRAVEAAKAQETNNRFQLEATYLTLTSNVVVTALQEASLRGQIASSERLVELQQQVTRAVRGQRALGTASELDLLAQIASEAQTAATLPPLRKQLGQTRDELTALLGRLPADEPDETFLLEEMTLPLELPVSLPSKIVLQRPDVRAAEANLHIASAEAGIALANLLPQFTITAETGSSALAMSQLFKGGTGFWDVGASLTQTLFDAGALLHKHRATDAALDQAGAHYRAAVILACQNVADTLRALQADADALKASAEADRAAESAFELARKQQALGTISLVAMLNAEQTYQQAEVAVVQARASRYADSAALFQALGGGWWNRPGESVNE